MIVECMKIKLNDFVGDLINLIYELTGKELVVKVGTNYQINPLALDL